MVRGETMRDLSNIEKINFLSRYKREKEKYIAYENQTNGVHSIDLNYVKSTVHPTLIDKIYRRDEAYAKMINSYIEINAIIARYIPCPNDVIMYDIFINGLSNEKITNKWHLQKGELNKILNYNLDLIKIN